MRREYTIIDAAGLHARPASVLVKEANKYPNNIMIEYNGKKLTLKSIMAVLSMGVKKDTTIAIEVDNDDAELVFEGLEKVLNEYSLI
jgi:phosphocarrier protein